MTPDVNVLVAAHRSDHPHHAVARAWLDSAVLAASGGTAITLMPTVLASFLRLVTNPKIFQQTTPTDDAVAFVDALLASPGVHMASLGAAWPRLRQLCLGKQLAGNDLPDAWLAAAVVQAGEHLVSFDRRFKRLLARGQFTRLSPASCAAANSGGRHTAAMLPHRHNQQPPRHTDGSAPWQPPATTRLTPEAS